VALQSLTRLGPMAALCSSSLSLKILCFAQRVNWCVVCGSQNKHDYFPILHYFIGFYT